VDLSGWFRALLSNYDDSGKRVRVNFMYSGWTRIDRPALVEAQRTLMPSTTSFKTDHPRSYLRSRKRHLHHRSSYPLTRAAFAPLAQLACRTHAHTDASVHVRDWWCCIHPPQPSKDFSNNSHTQSLSTCPLEMYVPTCSSLFDEAFVDDIQRFPKSRSPTTEHSTRAFMFLQAPGLPTL